MRLVTLPLYSDLKLAVGKWIAWCTGLRGATSRRGNFVCCFIIVFIFMRLGGTHRLGANFKVIIWKQARKGWDHFLWRKLIPWETKYRFSFGNWRRGRLDEMVKKWGRERFWISFNYSCIISFLVEILLVKLNLTFSILESQSWKKRKY